MQSRARSPAFARNFSPQGSFAFLSSTFSNIGIKTKGSHTLETNVGDEVEANTPDTHLKSVCQVDLHRKLVVQQINSMDFLMFRCITGSF